jgi:D-aminoacyl-tRNA deacylase
MRAVIQRVKNASVRIDNKDYSHINAGLLVLLGITSADDEQDISWLAQKIVNLRVFSDNEGKMNLSVKEMGGEIMVVSQFTLFASTKKGNRPSFIDSAKPEIAIPLYEKFLKNISAEFDKEIKTGIFGADMQIDLINDGPVTIIIDTKNKE